MPDGTLVVDDQRGTGITISGTSAHPVDLPADLSTSRRLIFTDEVIDAELASTAPEEPTPVLRTRWGITVALTDHRPDGGWRGIIIHTLRESHPVGGWDIAVQPRDIAEGRFIRLGEPTRILCASSPLICAPTSAVSRLRRMNADLSKGIRSPFYAVTRRAAEREMDALFG